MATPLSIHLERAALLQDSSRIPRIIEQMNMECLAIYDSYLNWVSVLQKFIMEQCGEDAHDEALQQMGRHAFADFVESYRGLNPREIAGKLAARLRAAGSTFWVTEDESRIRFKLDPWGGAVRQIRRPNGWEGSQLLSRDGDRIWYPCYQHYDDPVAFPPLRHSGFLSQERQDLPCFFATEVLFLEIMPIEFFGYPIAVLSIPEDFDQPVYMDVYKNLPDVPEQAYLRVGLTKPKQGFTNHGARPVLSSAECETLGVPLSIQVEKAAEQNDWERLLRISSQMDEELVGAKDPLGVLIAGLLTWIARHLGEDKVEEALIKTADVVMAPFVDVVRALDIKAAIQLWSMVWRSHGSTFWIEETPEMFVFRGRPLGACGRMWAHKYQTRVERISESRVRYPTFGSYDAPMCCHRMKEPKAITHGKTNYPIYSTHCHMLHEIYPIDQLGYPLWVEEHPLDDPDGVTVHVHYKNRNDWPEEYYRKVERKKPDTILE
jgi:hypothetical protein